MKYNARGGTVWDWLFLALAQQVGSARTTRPVPSAKAEAAVRTDPPRDWDNLVELDLLRREVERTLSAARLRGRPRQRPPRGAVKPIVDALGAWVVVRCSLAGSGVRPPLHPASVAQLGGVRRQPRRTCDGGRTSLRGDAPTGPWAICRAMAVATSGRHDAGKVVYPYHGPGNLLTWFGRDPEYEEKHPQWEPGKPATEPAKFHFVTRFHRGIELSARSGYRGTKRAEQTLQGLGLILVEGPNDVIRLSTLGVPAVALCSNTISREQAVKAAELAYGVAGGCCDKCSSTATRRARRA